NHVRWGVFYTCLTVFRREFPGDEGVFATWHSFPDDASDALTWIVRVCQYDDAAFHLGESNALHYFCTSCRAACLNRLGIHGTANGRRIVSPFYDDHFFYHHAFYERYLPSR